MGSARPPSHDEIMLGVLGRSLPQGISARGIYAISVRFKSVVSALRPKVRPVDMTDAHATPEDDDPFMVAFSAVLRDTIPPERQLPHSSEQGSLKAARLSREAVPQPSTLLQPLSTREFMQLPPQQLPWSVHDKAIFDERMLRRFDHVVLSRIPNAQFQTFSRNIVARCRRGHQVEIACHFAGTDFVHNSSLDRLR